MRRRNAGARGVLFRQLRSVRDFDLIFGAAKLDLKIVETPIHYKARVQRDRSRVQGWMAASENGGSRIASSEPFDREFAMTKSAGLDNGRLSIAAYGNQGVDRLLYQDFHRSCS
jgi:hypothetical protein